MKPTPEPSAIVQTLEIFARTPWLVFTILIFILLVIGILIFLLIDNKLRFKNKNIEIGTNKKETVKGERETDGKHTLFERKKSLTYEDIRPAFTIFLDLDRKWKQISKENIEIRLKGLKEKFVNLYFPLENNIKNFCIDYLTTWINKKNNTDQKVIKILEYMIIEICLTIREHVRDELFNNNYYNAWKEILETIKTGPLGKQLTQEGIINRAWQEYHNISLHRSKIIINTAKNKAIEIWPNNIIIGDEKINKHDISEKIESLFWTDTKGNNLKEKNIEESYILNKAANFAISALEIDLEKKKELEINKELLNKTRKEMENLEKNFIKTEV